MPGVKDGAGSPCLGPCCPALSRSLAAQSTGLDLDPDSRPSGNITLVYDDVPAAYTRAVEAGATPIHEPATKPWGQVSSYVLDYDKNLIEIASAINP